MKRVLLSVAVCGGLALGANAQMPDGSIAPNWTMTDYYGTSHTLYDYTDAGQSVVLDFFATWCGPCWSYAASGTMDDVWTTYGPSGTNEIIVISIEGDGSTNTADLEGTGSNTVGDWTTAITNILIDNASQTSAYQIGYWPTIYMVCPNRQIKEVGQLSSASAFYAEHAACPAAVAGTNAAVIAYNGDAMTCDGTVAVDFDIQNMGTNTLSNFDWEVRDGATVLNSGTWTGSLATYEMDNITTSVTISGATTIDVVITTSDASAADNTLSQAIAFAQTTDYEVEVVILTDDYADEIWWEITNSVGAIVASDGNENVQGNYDTGAFPPPSDPTSPLSNNQTYNWTVPLSSVECYTFTIYDYYGDGLGAGQWGGTDGTWTLKKNTGATIETFTGDFGGSDLALANNQTASTSVIELNAFNSMNVYPNPFNDVANIAFSLVEEADVTFTVTNVLGEVVYTMDMGTQSSGANQITFDGSDLGSGIYFFTMIAGENTITERVSLTK